MLSKEESAIGRARSPAREARALPNPHRMRLVESQDLAGAQGEYYFWIDNFLSIQLHTTLLDQAAGFSPSFCDRESSSIGCNDDCNCVLITLRRFGKLGIVATLFAACTVQLVLCFFLTA